MPLYLWLPLVSFCFAGFWHQQSSGARATSTSLKERGTGGTGGAGGAGGGGEAVDGEGGFQFIYACAISFCSVCVYCMHLFFF